MRASLEDALGLLSKWHIDLSRLDVILLTDGVLLIERDWFVSSFERGTGMVLSDGANPDVHNLVIAFELAGDFHYGGPRDAPEQLKEYLSDAVESFLSFAVGQTIVCLFERNTP